MKMTLGTGDKKKVGALAVLMLGALYGVYSNLTDTSTPSARPRKTVTTPGEADLPTTPAASPSGPDIHRAVTANKPKSEEFRPSLHKKGETVDPTTIDPTLRTDLLAKVQAVKPEEAQRNIFQFGPAQPPPATLAKNEPIVKPTHPAYDYPRPLPEKKEVAETKPPEPPEPPITYKYYGLSSTKIDGKKTAFFLDGDEIILATEGMVVKKRYRVVKIAATSVVMENVDSKKQQTVNYTEDAPNVSSGG